MNEIRLNKFLSECGISSRRKSEEFILQGRVTVNGKTVTKIGFKINPDKDIVTVDGEKVKPQKKVYFLLNKPKGFVTTTRDEKNRPVVTSLIKTNAKIFPVGRLDLNTTGALILTNDGEFYDKLLHPRNGFVRKYFAVLDKPLNLKDKEKLLTGVYLKGRKSHFTKVIFPSKKNFKLVEVHTTEGIYHFVKRMFEAVGYHVKKLDRSAIGPFTVQNIPVGSYRKLTPEEVNLIKRK